MRLISGSSCGRKMRAQHVRGKRLNPFKFSGMTSSTAMHDTLCLSPALRPSARSSSCISSGMPSAEHIDAARRFRRCGFQNRPQCHLQRQDTPGIACKCYRNLVCRVCHDRSNRQMMLLAAGARVKVFSMPERLFLDDAPHHGLVCLR